MRRLVLETTAPFQGLPELVAYHEGLAVEDFCDRHDMGVDVVHLESVPHWVPPFPLERQVRGVGPHPLRHYRPRARSRSMTSASRK